MGSAPSADTRALGFRVAEPVTTTPSTIITTSLYALVVIVQASTDNTLATLSDLGLWQSVYNGQKQISTRGDQSNNDITSIANSNSVLVITPASMEIDTTSGTVAGGTGISYNILLYGNNNTSALFNVRAYGINPGTYTLNYTSASKNITTLGSTPNTPDSTLRSFFFPVSVTVIPRLY